MVLPFLNSLWQGGERWEPARRAQCVNNLKQIQLALLNYERDFGAFPPRVTRDRVGRPLVSWRVLILPYLEQKELYARFRLDEPWDSPHNVTLIAPIPPVYRCPRLATWIRDLTVYQVLDGPGAFLDDRELTRSAQIKDDRSAILGVVEGPRAVPWTSPEDVPFRTDRPFPGWGATHPGGFTAAFADGSVRFLKHTIRDSVLKALATRAGGETIDPDSY
jgi:prepilin-type processing-associated H-X9-DG protein